jgi:hypothetical protein
MQLRSADYLQPIWLKNLFVASHIGSDAGDLCGVARGNERVGSRGDSQGDVRSAGPSIRVIQGGRSSRDSGHLSPSLPSNPQELSLEGEPELQLPDNWQQLMAEREGFEPDSGPKSNQQATESESNSIPTDPRKSP